MNDKKSNCCDTDNPDCNTQETNCCSTGITPASGGNKKKMGLGILLLAMLFAVISAFTMGTDETASCSPGQESCATSCEPESTGSSCCSTK